MIKKSILSLIPILLIYSSNFGFKPFIEPYDFRISVQDKDLVDKVRYQFTSDSSERKLASNDICLSNIHSAFRVWVEGYNGEFEWHLQSGDSAQLEIFKKGKDSIRYVITYLMMSASKDTVYIEKPDERKTADKKPSKIEKRFVKKSRE